MDLDWAYVIGYLLGLKHSIDKAKLDYLSINPDEVVRIYAEDYNWPTRPNGYEDNKLSALNFWVGYRTAVNFGDLLHLSKRYQAI